MSIDRDFIEKIQQMTDQAAETIVIDGHTYARSNLIQVEPTIHKANSIPVHTISAIVNYVDNMPDDLEDERGYFIHVKDIHTVILVSGLDEQRTREVILTASAVTGDFPFGTPLYVEDFIVQVQTNFFPNKELGDVLRLVGNIRKDANITNTDDGTTQKVTAKTGISLSEEVNVPNPIMLAPYATFTEIAQPEKPHILRVKDGREGPVVTLHDCYDPRWRTTIIEDIKQWLHDRVDLPIIG